MPVALSPTLMVSAAQQVALELPGGHTGKLLILPLQSPPGLPPVSRAVPSLVEGGSTVWGGCVEEDLGIIV